MKPWRVRTASHPAIAYHKRLSEGSWLTRIRTLGPLSRNPQPCNGQPAIPLYEGARLEFIVSKGLIALIGDASHRMSS